MPDLLHHLRPCVIVLCGGASRRMSGRDKTRESFAGTTVMDYLLNTLPSQWDVVCVGEERPTTRSVRWCRESPVGGGPVAGIAAGLDHCDSMGSEVCSVVGGDMPFAGPTVPTLVGALSGQPGVDAILATDPDGRTQPLLAAYRCRPLRAALPWEPAGARLMQVVEALESGTMACEARVVLDVDTPEALEQARHIVGS